MKAKLFGYRDINMTDKETGRLIVGTSCFFGFVSTGVQGLETTKVFINADAMNKFGFRPVVDGLVELDYGPGGRLVGVKNINEK